MRNPAVCICKTTKGQISCKDITRPLFPKAEISRLLPSSLVGVGQVLS